MTPDVLRMLGAKRAEQRHRIREELGKRDHSQSTIAKELGITAQAVSHVFLGKGHSKRVLAKLREIGVPEKYLFDPSNQKAV